MDIQQSSFFIFHDEEAVFIPKRNGTLNGPSYRTGTGSQFHHAPMQASISALPPPDQWNDHVLAHFTSMSADHHRGLIQDIHLKIRDYLPLAMQFGWQHPSHMQLQNVSRRHACGVTHDVVFLLTAPR